MRILIDFTQIPVKRTGAGVYAENLIRALVPLIEPDDRLFLLLQSDETVLRKELQAAVNVHILSIPSRPFRNRFALMLFEQLIFPSVLLLHRIDVLHSLHYTLPLWSPAARVVTFHDMTMLLWPQLHTRGRRLIMPLYMRLAAKLADAILFVSAATQRDAEKLMQRRKKFDAVTPLGVGPDSFLIPSAAAVESGLEKLAVRPPYLLFIGTIEPRKNLVRLIQAFDWIATEFPKHSLVLAGKLGWNFDPVLSAMRNSPFGQRIRHLGYISEDQKRILLAACDILIYPSLYEGFGLPVLEAMAAGVPVITSNVSSLPEVAANAAILVDPESVDQLAATIHSLLSDAELAQSLRIQGRERALSFSWNRTAAETYKAYQSTYHGQTAKA